MPTLRVSYGEWDLPHFHEWKSRESQIAFRPEPIVGRNTYVATIGSCFAEELATVLGRWEIKGAMNPTGKVYNTRSIRQEIDRAFGGWSEKDLEQFWKIDAGYISPFYHPRTTFATPDALAAKMHEMETAAAKVFQEADVIVITLGLIESWNNHRTGNCYRYIPHPEVFKSLGVELHRLTVQEMKEDLRHVRDTIHRHSNAKIILTVSPIPLEITMSAHDVRVANCESKCRIRAAVSEFVEEFPDVHYFHSYEIMTTGGSLSEFMKPDGRHPHRHAVDLVTHTFLRRFGDGSVSLPEIDLSWLSPQSST